MTVRYELCLGCEHLRYVENYSPGCDCLICVVSSTWSSAKKIATKYDGPSQDAIEGFETVNIPSRCAREPYPTMRKLVEL